MDVYYKDNLNFNCLGKKCKFVHKNNFKNTVSTKNQSNFKNNINDWENLDKNLKNLGYNWRIFNRKKLRNINFEDSWKNPDLYKCHYPVAF